MAVDASARHREAVHVLMLLGRQLEQLEPLLHLRDTGWEGHTLDTPAVGSGAMTQTEGNHHFASSGLTVQATGTP
jgi:hypothetical protein